MIRNLYNNIMYVKKKSEIDQSGASDIFWIDTVYDEYGIPSGFPCRIESYDKPISFKYDEILYVGNYIVYCDPQIIDIYEDKIVIDGLSYKILSFSVLETRRNIHHMEIIVNLEV
jgi:hypothetical protein